MITKERLEELIEQGVTIWSSHYGEFKLNKENCEICKVTYLNGKEYGYLLQHTYIFGNKEHTSLYELESLEEDLEKVHWEENHFAVKIEKFEPPMELKIDESYNFTFYLGYGYIYRRELWNVPYGFVYKCKKCGNTGVAGRTPKEAKENWNEIMRSER